MAIEGSVILAFIYAGFVAIGFVWRGIKIF